MKASELRKNNLIKDIESGRIGSVLTIGKTKIACQMEVSHLLQDESEWESIPLTEDWLIRFGFEKKNYGWFSIILSPSTPEGFVILDLNIESKSTVLFGEEGMEAIFISKIDYIHQLQNAVFVLSGEELTIKEYRYDTTRY